MGWRLWWWQKIRRADIAPELRERFEFYGERLVTLAIESGGSDRIGSELADLGRHKRTEIVAWLQERRDLTAQQEDRQETVEWALLVFVVVSVVLEVYRFWIGR
jgi:hypothetical protein